MSARSLLLGLLIGATGIGGLAFTGTSPLGISFTNAAQQETTDAGNQFGTGNAAAPNNRPAPTDNPEAGAPAGSSSSSAPTTSSTTATPSSSSSAAPTTTTTPPEAPKPPAQPPQQPSGQTPEQAVLALVLLEPIAIAHPDRLPPHAEIRAAIDAAMDHVAYRYWGGFGADFLYMEENWHCLAARAALPHHRHDGYERFCVDYVRWKTRLVLDETDGVAPDLVGGYGFGNLVLPWTAGSATFGEAAAADRIQKAVDAVLTEGRVRTRDIGGTATTTEFTEAVAARM